MNNLSPFYSVRGSSTIGSEHQLDNLGNQQHLITVGGIGRRSKHDWDGPSSGQSITSYRSTTTEDYDRAFAYRLCKIKPVYEIDGFLNYHYTYYIQTGQPEETFLKHMKYVVLPLLTKMKNVESYIEIFNEWLKDKSQNKD